MNLILETSCFSLAAVRTLFSSLNFEKFHYNVSDCGTLLVTTPTWSFFFFFLVSWMFIFMFFIRFGKLSAMMSSNILSALDLPSETPTMNMLICLVVSPRSLRFCLIFFSVCLFLFFRLDNFHCLIFTFTDYFACLNLPLNTFSDFIYLFTFSVVLFRSRLSFWFLFRFSIPLLIFNFC